MPAALIVQMEKTVPVDKKMIDIATLRMICGSMSKVLNNTLSFQQSKYDIGNVKAVAVRNSL